MSEIRDLFVGATALHEGYAVPTENKEHLQRILRRLVFNVARPGGSSVPDVRICESTSPCSPSTLAGLRRGTLT